MRQLSRDALLSACREVIPGARVVAVRHLRGGQSALTSAIRVETRHGRREWLILRRFVTDWVQLSSHEKAANEHRALMAIQATDVPAPRALWVDADRRTFGIPATLQSRLPGRAWWPDAIPATRARQMGRALAEIHSCSPTRGLPQTRNRVKPFLANEQMRRALGDAHPAGTRIWAALQVAGLEPLRREDVLLHGDYHAGNVLWVRGRLRGIVDWETAQGGPRGRDLGYTRMDCTITGGPEMADALTEGYGGQAADLWFWELLAAAQAVFAYRDWAPAWSHYGLTELTVRTVRRRLDAFIERVLADAP